MAGEPFSPAYEFNFHLGADEIGLGTLEYQETHATFDTTVHKDKGATSVGLAEYTCNVRFECPFKVADAAKYPDSGDRIYSTFVSHGKIRVGYIAISSCRERLGGKGGKMLSYEGVFSGTVSNVVAGATS